ncbi:uncharacterized protein ARMOST_01393 [Armillaria ostoyae]|uniref:Uncharacterized protein n=1 Tax=Armillaria ostoyae TaxID=47428 RepID=A0A284QNV7_ARMOS|nr:uncharacterized protein ARMOST_01393 [Armillaria ostoyae]
MPSWLLPARLHAGPRPSDNAHLDAAYAMVAVPIHSFHEVLLLVTLGLHLTSYTLSQSKAKSWSKRRSSLAALRCHERTASGQGQNKCRKPSQRTSETALLRSSLSRPP